MTPEQAVDRILATCENIKCNAVPYQVDGDVPIHLPPVDQIAFHGPVDLAAEFRRRGASTDAEKYDVVHLGSRFGITTSEAKSAADLCLPHAKIYAVVYRPARSGFLSNMRTAGCVLIDERTVEEMVHIVCRPPRTWTKPAWDWVAKGSLLVHSGGGFGDDISAARYAARLREMAGTVIFEARPEMRTMLEETADWGKVINKGEGCDCDHDFHVAAEDVFGRFANTPTPRQFLRTPEGGVFEDGANERVGVAYQGHHVKYTTRRRFPASELECFSRFDVPIYCLQKTSDYEEPPEVLPDGITDLAPTLETWLDTAWAVGRMKCVVTPDTSLFHLSAAMGVETHVCLKRPHASHYCQWEEAYSRYYPNVTNLHWGDDAFRKAADEIARMRIKMV